MNNRSIELLRRILAALEQGLISDIDVSIDDIKDCVEHEVIINKQCFSAEKYTTYLSDCKEIFSNDRTSLNHILRKSISFLENIPTSFGKYLEESWWEVRLGDKYTKEVEEVITYMRDSGEPRVFNYAFTSKYDYADVDVFYDNDNGHNYIIYKGKKMYFPLSWDVDKIIAYCRGIFCEQDIESPHCYSQSGYEPTENDIVIDAGVAEGNFSLNIIDSVKFIYMIEPDEEWQDALRLTFEPYKEKVTFIKAFLSDATADSSICLDDICDEVNYIKMDIEGFEKGALEGGVRLLNKCSNMRLAVCAYHCDGDEQYISDLLLKNGFEIKHSRGYMFPEWEPGALHDCRLRRGLVLGRKQ